MKKPVLKKANMKCNKVRPSPRKDKKRVVKACDKGKEKIVHFGDPKMRIKKSQPKRRKSFRARHGCDAGKLNKLKAKYWSCREW
tara:strand:- start:256 stop:507 length:252 start_codon:yes stop_codon:yes gene_type:complete